jgi:hypothetical protein
VSGAIVKELYLDIIRKAGFTQVTIQKERKIQLDHALLDQYLDPEQKAAFLDSNAGIYSITVSGQKPSGSCCGSSCCA